MFKRVIFLLLLVGGLLISIDFLSLLSVLLEIIRRIDLMSRGLLLGFAIAALIIRFGSSDLVEDVLDATGDLVVVATISTIVLLLRAGLLLFIV